MPQIKFRKNILENQKNSKSNNIDNIIIKERVLESCENDKNCIDKSDNMNNNVNLIETDNKSNKHTIEYTKSENNNNIKPLISFK